MRSSPFQLFWILFFFFISIFFNFTSPSLSLPSSPAPNNLTLSGDAHFTNNAISLTQELNCLSPRPPLPSSSRGVGRAFYVFPIRFLDPSTNTTLSFSCRFSFRITRSSSFCSFGDGFAFVIASRPPDSAAFSGGFMGLPEQELPVNVKDSFVAVEFDTSFDQSLGDINDNHVGLDVNSAVSLASVDAFSKGIDLKSGKQMTAWIEYRDAGKTIKVWVGYSQQVKPSSPLLAFQIDLSRQLNEFMHVGFSASNTNGSAIHFVEQWRFKTYNGRFSSIMPMDTATSGDCFMCSPPDSRVQNGGFLIYPHLDKRVGELVLGLVVSVAFIISVSIVIAIVICCLTRRKRLINGQLSQFQGNKLPQRLSLSEIKSATKGFNRHRVIGEGGASTVYEGSIPSHGAVAVKRFSQVNRIGPFRNQFSTELATMMGCLRHKNLVQLQGWCCEANELVLVYEYMPNGSLDKILHNRHENAVPIFLTWEKRMNIVLGVASALVYLHEECERQIIHRDVKTCNILLDSDLNAKLGDFGLAAVYDHSSMTREATIPAGTMGYLAPEYVYSGVPTVKTDVYSFGVVVLEVASGKRPVADDGTLLADWVWGLWGTGALVEAADARLRGRFSNLEMERVLVVGLSCVHPDSDKRPTVKEAAKMLRGEAPLPILPARKPVVSIRSVLPLGSKEIMGDGGDENGNLDDTPWLTPRTHF